jgi:hypothetical protein
VAASDRPHRPAHVEQATRSNPRAVSGYPEQAGACAMGRVQCGAVRLRPSFPATLLSGGWGVQEAGVCQRVVGEDAR